MKTKSIVIGISIIGAIAAAAIFVPGVPKAPDPVAVAQLPKMDLSITNIQKNTQGFAANNVASAKTAYVFFDPRCPHCHDLWNAAKTANVNSKVVWIPVGMMGVESITQGATILGGGKTAMDQHESTFEQGGITPQKADVEKYGEVVRKNAEYLMRFASSIPFIVVEDGSNKLVTHSGAMDTKQFESFINTGKTN